MKRSDHTLPYSAVQFLYWMGLAIIMAFSSPYLMSRGFTSGPIGWLLAGGGALSAVIQPPIAAYADRPGSMPLKRLTLIMGAGVVLLCAALWAGLPTAVTGVLYILAIALVQGAQPLVNSLAVLSEAGGARLNFGVARGAGSVAYATAAFSLGTLVDRVGGWIVPVIGGGVFLLFSLALAVYPRVSRPQTGAEDTPDAGGSPIQFMKKYPRFAWVLVGCVGVYISHSLLNNFTFQISQSKGGGGTEMGVAVAIAALIEVPIMCLYGLFRKKAPSHFWLKVSGVFFFLKCLATLLAPSIPFFYAVQVFQILGWAVMAVNLVYYVTDVVAPEDAVKGQAYATVTYSAAVVIGSVVGGSLIDSLGVPAMLLFGSLCAAAGVVLFFLFGSPKKG